MKESYSICVVISVACIIVCALFFFSSPTGTVMPQSSTGGGRHWETQQPRSEDEAKRWQLAMEFENADAYYANGFVHGLVELLNSGRPSTKLRVCRYLKELEAFEALAAMEHQMELCKGTSLEEAIRVRYNQLRTGFCQ